MDADEHGFSGVSIEGSSRACIHHFVSALPRTNKLLGAFYLYYNPASCCFFGKELATKEREALQISLFHLCAFCDLCG